MSDYFAGLVCGFLFAFLLFMTVMPSPKDTREEIYAEAIKAGVGEYRVMDDKGKTEFFWKTNQTNFVKP